MRQPRPGSPDVQLATRVRAELYRAIKIHCVQEGLSIQTFVTEALEEYLNTRPPLEEVAEEVTDGE